MAGPAKNPTRTIEENTASFEDSRPASRMPFAASPTTGHRKALGGLQEWNRVNIDGDRFIYYPTPKLGLRSSKNTQKRPALSCHQSVPEKEFARPRLRLFLYSPLRRTHCTLSFPYHSLLDSMGTVVFQLCSMVLP